MYPSSRKKIKLPKCLTQRGVRFELTEPRLKVGEIYIEKHHGGVTNHMSAASHWHLFLQCTASLFHCSASLLSANVLHSGSSVNYSTSQEGRGTWWWWWWGLGAGSPDHKTWQAAALLHCSPPPFQPSFTVLSLPVLCVSCPLEAINVVVDHQTNTDPAG